MAHFERHVFVCVNERAPTNSRGCCLAKGAAEVRAAFKKAVAERGLKGVVRANNSGCLDRCEHGVTVVVYPEQVWYGGVTVADVDEIMSSHIINGVVVDRLRIDKHDGNDDDKRNDRDEMKTLPIITITPAMIAAPATEVGPPNVPIAREPETND